MGVSHTFEGQAPEDAEYLVRLELGPDQPAPEPEDHPGLLFRHLLDPADAHGPRTCLTWWRGRADYERERQPLTAADGVRPVHEGYVRQAAARERSWLRRVGPYNLFVYLVTVVTGLISIYAFAQWVFQPPRLAVEVQREPRVLGAPFPLDLGLRLVNHSAEVPARLDVDRVVLRPVGGDGEPVTLSTLPVRTVEVAEHGEGLLAVRGEPVNPGTYAVEVHGKVRGGMANSVRWPVEGAAAPKVRVWPETSSLEVGGIKPMAEPGKALLSGWFLTGRNQPNKLHCKVVVTGEGDFEVAASSVPGRVTRRKVGLISILRWSVDTIRPFDAQSILFALSAREDTSWDGLHVTHAGCSEPSTETGDPR